MYIIVHIIKSKESIKTHIFSKILNFEFNHIFNSFITYLTLISKTTTTTTQKSTKPPSHMSKPTPRKNTQHPSVASTHPNPARSLWAHFARLRPCFEYSQVHNDRRSHNTMTPYQLAWQLSHVCHVLVSRDCSSYSSRN